MRIRADFDAPAVVAADEHRWLASPEPGVERVMLDRIGDEVAVATSLVRYAPGSRFAPHRHERGEEFLVLDGVFGDERARYPAGTYVRNPPGSTHSPYSDDGCLLFVKLRQFVAGDATPVALDTTRFGPTRGSGAMAVRVLHRFRRDEVLMIEGVAERTIVFEPLDVPRECLVIDGSIDCGERRLNRLGWLRMPAGRAMRLRFAAAGKVLVKTRPVLQ